MTLRLVVLALLLALSGPTTPATAPTAHVGANGPDAWARFIAPLDGDAIPQHDVRFAWTRAAPAGSSSCSRDACCSAGHGALTPREGLRAL